MQKNTYEVSGKLHYGETNDDNNINIRQYSLVEGNKARKNWVSNQKLYSLGESKVSTYQKPLILRI
mgnify:CR=1 FL=1|jgi:hypothetical protein